jgi:hypothetical protein
MLLAPFVAGLALLSGQFALAQVVAVASGVWQDPAVWSRRTVPVAGQTVLIPANVTLRLNGSTAAVFGSLELRGTLRCDPSVTSKDFLSITANAINVFAGSFLCGSPASPFLGKLNITLTGDATKRSVSVANGGNLQLHGPKKASTWTRLAANALVNSNSIILEQGVDWAINDTIGKQACSFRFQFNQ